MHFFLLMISMLITPMIMLQAQASGGVLEPPGYRMDNYRTPTPATLAGATVVDAIELHELITSNHQTALIDVLPLERKPPDFPPDRLWLTPTRYNIPGSVWLPNVGDGTISPLFKEYFVANLDKIVSERNNPPLVFYCLVDCWMSWNAAKRAIELGYPKVYWFPGGTDEWEVMGYQLEPSEAVQMPAFRKE